MKRQFSKIVKWPAKGLIFFISIYQKILSPDHGLFKARYPYGFCRHYPSCSEYSKKSIAKFGVIKGLYLTLVRVVKCNPFSDPKIDQIP